jgi:hypothetical protein
MDKVGQAAHVMIGRALELGEKKADMRRKLASDESPFEFFTIDAIPFDGRPVHVVDGAFAMHSTIGGTFIFSVIVGLGPHDIEHTEIETRVMPHMMESQSIARGLMTMMEMMAIVKLSMANESSLVVMDGSKISFIIAINQFYGAFADDLDVLRDLRDDCPILRQFESKDWFFPFLTAKNVVGHLKQVTTRRMVRVIAPEFAMKFDDQALANMILDDAEAVVVPMRAPKAPFHVSRTYPFSPAMEQYGRFLGMIGHPMGIGHLYAKIGAGKGACKLEFNEAFRRSDPKAIEQLIAWVNHSTIAKDMVEPYLLAVADKMVKSMTKSGMDAFSEIVMRRGNIHAFELSRSVRTF